MTQETQPTPTPVPIESNRKTFDRIFRDRVIEVGNELLAQIPELDALAFIPIWHVRQDALPTATIIPRTMPMAPHIQLSLIDQLRLATEKQVNGIVNLIAAFDMELGRLHEKRDQLRDEIGQLNNWREGLKTDLKQEQGVDFDAERPGQANNR